MTHIEELPKKIAKCNIPFKISAGPGAGKTTWLVSHVQNVIKNSDRLDKMKKVACITHTRIGANTVNKKIKVETGTNRLDIGTIHSFLYRNVIKPFSFLIEKDEYDNILFNSEEFNGIIENRLNRGRFSSWKKDRIAEKKFYLFDEKLTDSSGSTNLEKTKDCLNSIDWKILNGEVSIGLRKKYWPKLKIKNRGNIEERTVSKADLFEYKKKYWTHGIMHHEDVLYFTHYIFENYPKTVEFVSKKFPYLFLDEFQDTNPLQTWIVKQLSEKETIIGVIGDPAQSIFEFAGAQRKDFKEFDLPDLIIYKKSDNFRSTKKIIDFLKELRDDIEQIPSDECKNGEDIVVIVGKALSAAKYINDQDDDSYAILCRYNKDVSLLKFGIQNVQSDNLISGLYYEDSNNQRPRFIHSLLKAYDFFAHREYKEAIREVNKNLRDADIDGMEKRKLAINIIEYLLKNADKQILDIYNNLKGELKNYIKLTGIRKTKGIYKPIYLNKFEDFLPFLSKQTQINSHIRTIHQAKGDEFNNVLLCLFDKTDKNGDIKKSIDKILDDYIFNSRENIKLDTSIGEETRLVYVACSRAKKRLFINVPRLSSDEELKMSKIGLRIERF